MDNSWLQLNLVEDEEIPLFRTALLIAQDEYPQLAAAEYEARLDGYFRQLRTELSPALLPAAQLQHLNRFLFEEVGFAGNEIDYYDPRNSYLNDVLDRRLGNPISLAVVQLELAQRLDIPLQGVSFPGHFLVRLPVDDGLIVLDPYQKGRSLDETELRSRAQGYFDAAREIDDHHLARMLEPASHRAILTRMLRNLKAVYSEREDLARAVRCSDRLLSVDPHQHEEYRDRGLLYLRLEHIGAAREDLRRYLKMEPTAADADTIRLQLADISSAPARLN